MKACYHHLRCKRFVITLCLFFSLNKYIPTTKITKDASQVFLSSNPIDLPLPLIKPLNKYLGDFHFLESLILELFFVYSYLKRFSTMVFLIPLTLDDFVGVSIFEYINTLLDNVHIHLSKGYEASPKNTSS